MRHPSISLLAVFTLVLAVGRGADMAPAPAGATGAPPAAPATPVPGVVKGVFGTMSDGTQVDVYTLTNHHGLTAKIITYGATIAELDVPDRDGKSVSVVKGGATMAAIQRVPGAGPASIMGRVANRIGAGKFTLDGKDYQLAINNAPNTLHGGRVGFDKKNWTGEIVTSPDGPAVKLTYVSKDGEENFPGTLTSSLTYTLTEKDALRLAYSSTTDQPTLVNLVCHAYFNLAGGGDTSAHVLQIFADQQTVLVNALPTGEIAPVKGTPEDFTAPIALSKAGAALGAGGRYDHSFVINRAKGDTGMVIAARVSDPASGRQMEVWTTQPGVMLYTSPFGGGGGRGSGHANDFYCFETQHYPDSIHHDNFPSIVLRPGETAATETEYRFSVNAAK